MTTHPPVPADVDADSLADLLLDCSVLEGFGAAAPLRLPLPRPTALSLDERTVALTDGMAEYGV